MKGKLKLFKLKKMAEEELRERKEKMKKRRKGEVRERQHDKFQPLHTFSADGRDSVQFTL